MQFEHLRDLRDSLTLPAPEGDSHWEPRDLVPTNYSSLEYVPFSHNHSPKKNSLKTLNRAKSANTNYLVGMLPTYQKQNTTGTGPAMSQ